MRRFAIACVVAGVLGACATPDAERFIDRYRLQAAIGPLYEIHGQDGVVGWLYGAVHYGTVERPSLSRAAARVLPQTRHIYLELTDGPGNSWPMRDAIAADLKQIAQAKEQAAKASSDKAWQDVVRLQKLGHASGAVPPVRAGSQAYY